MKVIEKAIRNNKNKRRLKIGQKKMIVLVTKGNEKIKYIAEDWLYIAKTMKILILCREIIT